MFKILKVVMISMNHHQMMMKKKHTGVYGVLGRHVQVIVNNIDEDIVL
jgi:hypothetical protein